MNNLTNQDLKEFQSVLGSAVWLERSARRSGMLRQAQDWILKLRGLFVLTGAVRGHHPLTVLLIPNFERFKSTADNKQTKCNEFMCNNKKQGYNIKYITKN